MTDGTTGENFCHLHNHTYYSLLDGLSSPTQMAQEAKRQGFKSLAITDHGTCGGWFNFQKACREEEIKPILGSEMYVSDDMRSRDKTQSIYHLTLLAKNATGLKNLMHLSTMAGVSGFYKKPRIDFDLLSKHHEGIICSSGCPASELSHAVVDDDYKKCKSIMGKYKDLFGDDYYLEVMHHKYGKGKEEWQATESKIAKNTFKLARKFGMKAICTNDAHYAAQSDAEFHDTLLCVQTRGNVNDPKRFSFKSDEFYLKSYEEMLKIYGKSPDLLKNTVEISEKIVDEDLLKFAPDLLPHFAVPSGFKDELDYLKTLIKEGMIAYGFINKAEYRERIQFEMGVIANCGYVKYFLILWDIINFANSSGIRVGIGRGCFTPESKVDCDGDQKEIQDVQIGDMVLSYDGKYHEVLDTLIYDAEEELYEIELDDGRIITCTDNHEIHVDRDGILVWVRADELTEEDDIFDIRVG